MSNPTDEGILYVVATPIGNLEDITLRAIRILKEADLIAAEDTRHTKKLLNHYGIGTPSTSYHEHNEERKISALIDKIKGGASIALVTDAGTPCVSDPGYKLICGAVEAGIKVVSIPGASAIIGALSSSGLPTDEFTFKGFLSSKEVARTKQLMQMVKAETTYIVYESPGRLIKLLKNVEEIMGNVNIVVARELTKVYEECIRGTVSEVLDRLGDLKVKGEITVVIRSKPIKIDRNYGEVLSTMLKEGVTVKEASAVISKDYNVSKKEVYKKALAIKESN